MDPTRSNSDIRIFSNLANFEPIKGGFSSASLSLRAQKKLASRFSNRTFAKQFVSQTASRLLDHIYSILAKYYSKRDAERAVKGVIKLLVKLALISRSGKLSDEEDDLLDETSQKVHSLALTITSFYKLNGSYDRSFLLSLLSNVKAALDPVVQNQLSDKSAKRLNEVFQFIVKPEFLDSLFSPDGSLHELLPEIAVDIEKLIEDGEI